MSPGGGLVSERRVIDGRPATPLPVFLMDEDFARLDAATPGASPVRAASESLEPQHLAYCIYTSGSTGGPKGVGIPHGAVLNFLGAMQHDIGLGASDRVLALTSLSFDIAVLELYWPLCMGVPIELVDRETAHNPAELLTRIERSAVSLVQATPATWQMLSREPGFERLPPVRKLCGGVFIHTFHPKLKRSNWRSIERAHKPLRKYAAHFERRDQIKLGFRTFVNKFGHVP